MAIVTSSHVAAHPDDFSESMRAPRALENLILGVDPGVDAVYLLAFGPTVVMKDDVEVAPKRFAALRKIIEGWVELQEALRS